MRLVFTYAGASMAVLSLLVAMAAGFRRSIERDAERNALLAAVAIALIAIALAVLSLGGR